VKGGGFQSGKLGSFGGISGGGLQELFRAAGAAIMRLPIRAGLGADGVTKGIVIESFEELRRG
jgi:hypothetical protein